MLLLGAASVLSVLPWQGLLGRRGRSRSSQLVWWVFLEVKAVTFVQLAARPLQTPAWCAVENVIYKRQYNVLLCLLFTLPVPSICSEGMSRVWKGRVSLHKHRSQPTCCSARSRYPHEPLLCKNVTL